MPLQGNLKEFNLLEIFQLLSLGTKSGTLAIERDSQQLKFTFQRGEITFHSNPKRPIPYQTLVNMGVLTEEEYQRIKPLGDNDLVSLGKLISGKEGPELKKIEQFYHKELLDNLLEISPWDEGTFSFEAKQIPDENIEMSFSVSAIENEVKKCLKEWAEIRQQLPPEDEPIGLSSAETEVSEIIITPEEWRIICALGNSKTFGELREAVPLSIFSLGKTLVSLGKKKLIKKDLSTKAQNRKSLSMEISRHFGGRKIKKQRIDIKEISGKYVVCDD